MLAEFLIYWGYLTVLYVFFVNSTYIALSAVSFFSVRNYLRRIRTVDDKLLFQFAAMLKPISILAPAYNEELSVIDNVRSLLSLNYPEYEVILINDGSTDNTLAKLTDAYNLVKTDYTPAESLPANPVRAVYRSSRHENLIVLDKENGGKADALNAGINYSRYPLFTAIDTDSLLERNVLLKMVRPFLENPETIAVGGIIRAINGCEVYDGEVVRVGLPSRMLPLFQIVEYLRAFLFGRVGWAAMRMLVVISGAFGMFHRQSVVEAGGYAETVGEDMELIVRLHRRMREKKQPYHIEFSPEPVCWTEVPESLRMLGRQRNRWSRGQMDTLTIHRKMLFNPAYGRIGLFAMPYALIVEGLGGFIELFGLIGSVTFWALGMLDGSFALAFLIVSLLYGVIVSLSALVLEELSFRRYPRISQILVLAVIGLLENFGYHQITLWWRIKGIIDYYRGKTGWGTMARTGFAGRNSSSA